MRAIAHVRSDLTVRLEEGEQFEWDTPTGKILVSEIHISEGRTYGLRYQASVRGFAIRKDGDVGYVHRNGEILLRELPKEVLVQAIAALRNLAIDEEDLDAVEGS
jgi:hypothetical protein